MTNLGFRREVSKMAQASKGISILYTDDESPPLEEDKEVSPLGRVVHSFDEVRYLGGSFPGHVSLVASKRFGPSARPTLVNRIGCVADGVLIAISRVADGIYPEGADRLPQRSSPNP